MGCVYLITNTLNGKYYVGNTQFSFINRWKTHLDDARRGSKFHLHSAIRRDGPEVFIYEILNESPSKEKLGDLERLWILTLRAYHPEIGYNMTLGRDGGVPTEVVREKLRSYAKNRSEEHRIRLARHNTWRKGKSYKEIYGEDYVSPLKGKK